MDAPPRETPRKNGQNRGAVAGQNQGDILESFQFRKATMKQYDNNDNDYDHNNSAVAYMISIS